VSARHPAAGTPANEQAVQEILQRQRARRVIEQARPEWGTAYGTASWIRQVFLKAGKEGRLKPVEVFALDQALEELVARAHAEGSEFVLKEIEGTIKEVFG
jgi:Zn finger protein HypA/HybF involved in hydrogenase expression